MLYHQQRHRGMSDTYCSLQCALQWRHNKRHNHRRLDCLLNSVFRRRSKKTSKLYITGLGEGNPPVTGGFPSQRSSNAENVSIWWRHHALVIPQQSRVWSLYAWHKVLEPGSTQCFQHRFNSDPVHAHCGMFSRVCFSDWRGVLYQTCFDVRRFGQVSHAKALIAVMALWQAGNSLVWFNNMTRGSIHCKHQVISKSPNSLLHWSVSAVTRRQRATALKANMLQSAAIAFRHSKQNRHQFVTSATNKLYIQQWVYGL